MAGVDISKTRSVIDREWESSILQTLSAYIEIPNLSPMFDPEWETNGLQDQAMDLLLQWVQQQQVPGLKYRIVREKGKTPVLFAILDGTDNSNATILLYGHMDKQPPTNGWHPGLAAYKAVLKDGKLYGRGGADDGYAIFSCITAIKALQEQKIPHGRLVILIEACEESGSKDLPFFMELLASEIGDPSLVICLDSGCGNYEQLWLTTSLRGMLGSTLSVKILTEGIHSGSASGIVPSTFRILRQLLDRVEDSKTGKLADVFYAPIPEKDVEYAKQVASTIGEGVRTKFPFVKGAHPIDNDLTQLLLNGTWRPTMCVTGADGIPSVANGGNVLRPETKLLLSFRLPPTRDPKPVMEFLKHEFERDPPYGAQVSWEPIKGQIGWCAPPLEPWLEQSLDKASNSYFKKPVRLTGEGGSIPFMGMLGEKYPKTQFVITGLLGPASNAHGPNEFMHVEMFKNVTACVVNLIADHYIAKNKK